MFEELDYPREFFVDAAAQVGRVCKGTGCGCPYTACTHQMLYYVHNASFGTPPPPSWTFEVPMLTSLFNLSGSAASPVVDVTITGITFTSVAASYLGPHGIPSGGDWGLSRMGAILIEGAQVLEGVLREVVN